MGRKRRTIRDIVKIKRLKVKGRYLENIKEELKKVIVEVMLPETEAYLEDINKAIDERIASEDDITAKADIEAFISELKTIVEVVDENKISDEDAKSVFEKITTMLEEHE